MKKLLSIILIIIVVNDIKSQNLFEVNPYLQIGNTVKPNSISILWHTKNFEKNWNVEFLDANNKWDSADTRDLDTSCLSDKNLNL